jgi:hypothetical protein
MIWVRRKRDTETSMPAGEPAGASCVQKSDDSRFCNSHCLSHFAAFFIVMGTKISIVENLVFVKSLVMLLWISFEDVTTASLLSLATLKQQLKAKFR